MQNKNDGYYIGKVLDGDTLAFTVLVEKYKTLAYNISLRIVKSSEDAEEITQDSFVKAYRSIRSFKGDSKFSTWLYRIVYNSSITHLRKNQREVPVDSGREFYNYQGVIDDEGSHDDKLLAALKKAVDSLPVQEQMMITLFYYDNKSIEEIAKITAISESNVKVRLFRTRKKLYESICLNMKNEVPVM
jgi:RNA polymerase sigma factor (sigma-70 family)